MAKNDLKLIVGRNVARARKKRDLTQAELAKSIKCSANFVALLETGRRAPSFNTLERLAKVLKVKPVKFFQ